VWRPQRLIPEASPEGSFDGGSRVAAPLGDVTNGVFLLQGVSSWQRSKPFAGARKCGATFSDVVLWSHASN
jgi:hypothetical protein